MIDAEDIINSITAYLTEDVGGISRINKAINDVNTRKGDTLLPNVSNDVILGQREKDWNTFTNGRLNIDIIGEASFIPTFDEVAKSYTSEVSYIIRDDGARNVFFRALRMEGVINDVMSGYLRDTQEDGVMTASLISSFTPERVLLGNTQFNAIKSGVVYNLILR